MKLIVTGVSETGHTKHVPLSAPSVKDVYNNPESYGFTRITTVQELRENQRRKIGRRNKRDF